MSNILITGATGNIGSEVIRYLHEIRSPNKIIAAVRDIEKSKKYLEKYKEIEYRQFDFEDYSSFNQAFKDINRLFILRPPHISNVNKYFKPFLKAAKDNGVNEVIFLSVQGAEKSKIIPHNKIERLIKETGFEYIFLRPSYFMQNLTTTLMSDIKHQRSIILPAGNAKFNWIDVQNIAEVAAILLDNFPKYRNRALELTGPENINFKGVVALINQVVDEPIKYRSVNPIRFYRIKKRQGMKRAMIMVMIMLHFLPRFQRQPVVSYYYEQLTSKKTNDLRSFIQREKAHFQ